jgi:hypothetical protein
MIDDTLEIPAFLRRAPVEGRPVTAQRQRREKTIPYPRDGYLGRGLRGKARERLRAARRRHAEKCRERSK